MHFTRLITTKYRGYSSITEDVNGLLSQSGVTEGYCVVTLADHTTALGITSFWDPRGLDDLMDEIYKNFPSKVNFQNQESPFDASGQVKASVMGRSAMFLISDGKLLLGSSQGLVILEFDGPREREYQVDFVQCPVVLSTHRLKTRYMGMHNLTLEINKTVEDSGIKKGVCHISMLHSTAGLLLCHRDEVVMQDVMEDIERMVPTRADFMHRETASDAGGHVKTAITDSQLSVIIEEGRLLLSPEQAIVFAEFDGPRPRSYSVGILAG